MRGTPGVVVLISVVLRGSINKPLQNSGGLGLGSHLHQKQENKDACGVPQRYLVSGLH